MKYPKKLILDYISGNDIDNYNIEELEDDYQFMMEVIKQTKDKRLYNLCSEKVQNNYIFVRFLIETFKKDISFITEVAEKYLSKVNKEDITYKELVIILSNISNSDYDNPLECYKAAAFASYLSTVVTIKKVFDERKIEDLGCGFILIQEEYKNSPIIIEDMAKRMIFDIFHNTEDNVTLEEIIHINYKDKKILEKQGVVNFIINHITAIDESLGRYISIHIELIKPIQEDITRILNNWDNYMNRLNERRVYIVYCELREYNKRNEDEFYFSSYQVFDEVVIEQKLDKVFQLSLRTTAEIELEESLDKTSSLKRKKLKNNISQLIKDIFKYDYLPKQIPEDKFRLEQQPQEKVIPFQRKRKKTKA